MVQKMAISSSIPIFEGLRKILLLLAGLSLILAASFFSSKVLNSWIKFTLQIHLSHMQMRHNIMADPSDGEWKQSPKEKAKNDMDSVWYTVTFIEENW